MGTIREQALIEAVNREERLIYLPCDEEGNYLKITDYFAENVFDFTKAKSISKEIQDELIEVSKSSDKKIKREHADIVANAVVEWASNRGATHFCHWFQPLTGKTAEKHDSFLDFKDSTPILRLSGSQLIQGEPDASSFPNGGARSTFEARGYTSWDLTSPFFLRESENGLILCIPTAFVSYSGEALDIKTPLLRSISALNESATQFLHLLGNKEVTSVHSNCGCEQEYFLVDKALYYARADLVMANRTVLGSLTAKGQQLSDHYFGLVPSRVLNFMQELDLKLHRLGVPAKTRHNEVAPGQFEIAPIYSDANLAADHNQILMEVIRSVAEKHNFVAILHEKPFAGINGSGKHCNWSMSTDTGENLLEPGTNPENNYRFLAMIAITLEAVFRHSKALRMAVVGHGNDHRLGGHEAPPSIISVFLGDTLNKIFDAVISGSEFKQVHQKFLNLGVRQLADLLQDNTDRNRTSPFAFTGNKFEFRAVGSSQAVGFPISIINTAIASTMDDAYNIVDRELKSGKAVPEALLVLIREFFTHSKDIVFTGDGYSREWIDEAEKRKLPNLKTTPEALECLKDEKVSSFLIEKNVYSKKELETRYNVFLENYNLSREIEFNVLCNIVNHSVLPSALKYKKKILEMMKLQKDLEIDSYVEKNQLLNLSSKIDKLYDRLKELQKNKEEALQLNDREKASRYAAQTLPLSEKVAEVCNAIEAILPDEFWPLPTYYDMLFLR